MLEMIRELCTLPGISGRENAVRDYIIDKIEGYTGILIEEVSIIIDKITKVEQPKETK